MIPIPREELERAGRQFCRRVASVMITAMADTDTDIATIAKRIGRKPRVVKGWLDRLIAGNDPGDGIAWIADFMFAMGLEMKFTIDRPAPGIVTRSAETSAAQAPGGAQRRLEPDAEGGAPE